MIFAKPAIITVKRVVWRMNGRTQAGPLQLTGGGEIQQVTAPLELLFHPFPKMDQEMSAIFYENALSSTNETRACKRHLDWRYLP